VAREVHRGLPRLQGEPHADLAAELAQLAPSVDDEAAATLAAFAARDLGGDGGEEEGEGGAAAAGREKAALFRALDCQDLLAGALRSGLRNDAPDLALVARQRFRRAECLLEAWAAPRAAAVMATLGAADGPDGAEDGLLAAAALLELLAGCTAQGGCVPPT